MANKSLLRRTRILSDASRQSNRASAAEPNSGTVSRALSLLSTLADAGGPATIKEVTERMALPPSTVHRLLHLMRVEGFVCACAGDQGSQPKTLPGPNWARLLQEVVKTSWDTFSSCLLLNSVTELSSFSTLRLKSGDHSTLDHPGTGMRAKTPEASRYCIRGFQAADSDRLLCERERQNVHADDLQIQ
jgi:hypothetical protein